MRDLEAAAVAMASPREGDGISERDFVKFCDVIHARLGLAIPASKRVMVETRLRKRARALGLPSVSQYWRQVFSGARENEEWSNLVDAITTHKTDFFREPVHFEYLIGAAIPRLRESGGAGTRRPLLVWSAACSTGEEPYTAAMVLSAYSESQTGSSYRFHIYASDISDGVLETARAGVYPEAAVIPVPKDLRDRYILRSKDPTRQAVRMTPYLRSLVQFRKLNLMDRDYGFGTLMDVIFCRNVLIYFDRPTQQRVLDTMCRTLLPGGYLFMGHSESLNGLDLPLSQVAAAVYRRADV